MDAKLDIIKISKLLELLEKNKFYGSVTIKYENGKINIIKKEESIKEL